MPKTWSILVSPYTNNNLDGVIKTFEAVGHGAVGTLTIRGSHGTAFEWHLSRDNPKTRARGILGIYGLHPSTNIHIPDRPNN